jgi:hypothetical protein
MTLDSLNAGSLSTLPWPLLHVQHAASCYTSPQRLGLQRATRMVSEMPGLKAKLMERIYVSSFIRLVVGFPRDRISASHTLFRKAQYDR